MKMQIYRDVAGQFRWRLKARNGEKIAASEGYTSKQNAILSAKLVIAYASGAVIEDVTDSALRLIIKR